MITREKRQELNKIFKEKLEIQGKIDHNLLEVKKLKKMWILEENDKNHALIERSIRQGESYISIQKTQLMNLSIQKIADKLCVKRHVVKHQSSLFNAYAAGL